MAGIPTSPSPPSAAPRPARPGRPGPDRRRAGRRRHGRDGQRLRSGGRRHRRPRPRPRHQPRHRASSAPPPAASHQLRPSRRRHAFPANSQMTCQAFTGGVQSALTDSTSSYVTVRTMSQDMTPRPGDLPAAGPRSRTSGETAPARPTPPTYSAPSPADRPTATRRRCRPGAARRPGLESGHDPRHRTGADPERRRRPGLVGTPPERRLGHPRLERRPTGRQPGQPDPAAPGTAPRSFPAPGAGLRCPRLPEQRLQHRLRQHRHRGPAAGRTAAKGRRTSVIVATTAALALLAGFGGGLVGAQLSSNSVQLRRQLAHPAQHQRRRRRSHAGTGRLRAGGGQQGAAVHRLGAGQLQPEQR